YRRDASSSSAALSSLQSSSQRSSSAADLACAARASNWSNSGVICGQSPRSRFCGTNVRGRCAANFPNGNKFMGEGEEQGIDLGDARNPFSNSKFENLRGFVLRRFFLPFLPPE